MLRAAYPGTQGTSNCRLEKQELSPSSLSKEYLLLSGTSGISYGKINADTHQSPGQSWPRWGGREWEGGGSLCAPSLEFRSHRGNQASWTRGVLCVYCQRLCQTWSQLRKLFTEKKLLDFFFSLFKRCSIQECEVTVQ